MMFRKRTQDDALPSRRQRRADATRRQALSPVRILLLVLCLPLTVALISFNMFVRLSDYGRNEAIIHLIALAGCDTAQSMGFGPFYDGYPGYHRRNDPDGDGMACETFAAVKRPQPVTVPDTGSQRRTSAPARSVGNAKFVKP